MTPENTDAFLAFYLTTEKAAGWTLLERYGLATLALLLVITALFVVSRKLGGVSAQVSCIACAIAVVVIFGTNVSSGVYDIWMSTLQTERALENRAVICQQGCYLSLPTLSTNSLSMKAETVSENPDGLSEIDILYAYHNALISQSSGNSGFILRRYVSSVDGYSAEITMPMIINGMERAVVLRIPADIILYAIPLSNAESERVKDFIKRNPPLIKALHPVSLSYTREIY